MLADSIKEVGLLNPIIVRKAMKVRNGAKAEAWEIVAGGHRYAACVLLKMESVACVVRDASDLLTELIAIDENLCRSELSPAEQAYQTARRKEIYEALHPNTTAGAFKGNQHTGKVASDKLSFTSQTAKATGRDKRTVERDAARGEALGNDLKRVAKTSLDKGVELDALAKLDKPAREEIIKKAENGEKVSARDTWLDDNRAALLAPIKGSSAAEQVQALKRRPVDRAKIAINSRSRMLREIAAIIVKHVPEDVLPALRANLDGYGSTTIAAAIVKAAKELRR
jgi:ParB-like chromosome segregation protein Spo0J